MSNDDSVPTMPPAEAPADDPSIPYTDLSDPSVTGPDAPLSAPVFPDADSTSDSSAMSEDAGTVTTSPVVSVPVPESAVEPESEPVDTTVAQFHEAPSAPVTDEAQFQPHDPDAATVATTEVSPLPDAFPVPSPASSVGDDWEALKDTTEISGDVAELIRDTHTKISEIHAIVTDLKASLPGIKEGVEGNPLLKAIFKLF